MLRVDAHHRDPSPLPQVLVLHLGERDVVPVPQAIPQARQDAPLVLQGGAGREV